MAYCSSCGVANSEANAYCEACGSALSALPTSPPPGRPSAAAAPGAAPAGSGSDPLGAAVGFLKGRTPTQLIIAAAVAVAILVAIIAIPNSMTEREYEHAAEDAIDDLTDAHYDWIGAATDLYYLADDTSEDVSESEIQDVAEAYAESKDDMATAAKEIKRLRPPREYKTEDEELNLWSAYLARSDEEFYIQLMDEMEAGCTYEDINDLYVDFYEDNEESDDAWKDAYDAMEELGLSSE